MPEAASKRLFLDLDGVLADFDKGVRQVTGQPLEALPPLTMWDALARAPGFFETLALVEDAQLRDFSPIMPR